jgi:hypothetical protein
LAAHQEEGQVKEFIGKILKSSGKFVLEESSNGTKPVCWMIKPPQRSMKDKE